VAFGRFPIINPEHGPQCVNCYRSMIACSLLRRAGFQNVINVIGGFDAWEKARLPFVGFARCGLDSRCRKYQCCGNQIPAFSRTSCHNPQLWRPQLSISCTWRGIHQPSSHYAGVKADKLITSTCRSFIELDAEIRRLHAELEEIRSQAKKKFYKAHATTAGA
jgi:hypothetical protein